MEFINCNMLTMYSYVHMKSIHQHIKVYIIVNKSVLLRTPYTIRHTWQVPHLCSLLRSSSYIMTMIAIFAVEIPLSFTPSAQQKM
jgi:hypothetical protein